MKEIKYTELERNAYNASEKYEKIFKIMIGSIVLGGLVFLLTTYVSTSGSTSVGQTEKDIMRIIYLASLVCAINTLLRIPSGIQKMVRKTNYEMKLLYYNKAKSINIKDFKENINKLMDIKNNTAESNSKKVDIEIGIDKYLDKNIYNSFLRKQLYEDKQKIRDLFLIWLMLFLLQSMFIAVAEFSQDFNIVIENAVLVALAVQMAVAILVGVLVYLMDKSLLSNSDKFNCINDGMREILELASFSYGNDEKRKTINNLVDNYFLQFVNSSKRDRYMIMENLGLFEVN